MFIIHVGNIICGQFDECPLPRKLDMNILINKKASVCSSIYVELSEVAAIQDNLLAILCLKMIQKPGDCLFEWIFICLFWRDENTSPQTEIQTAEKEQTNRNICSNNLPKVNGSNMKFCEIAPTVGF